MHIPDAFLNKEVTAVTDLAAYLLFALAARKVSKVQELEKIPRMGLTGAFIFAAGMFSFPVPGGTSAHLTGAALACILLGPLEGYFVFSVSILLQALLFQHGGLLSSGANILNMALVPLILSAPARKVLKKNLSVGAVFSGVVAAVSVLAGAVMCAVELWLSGHSDLTPVISAMTLSHILPSLLEGVLTATLVRGVWKKWNSEDG